MKFTIKCLSMIKYTIVSKKGYNGTVVNWALPGGSIRITLTVPLRLLIIVRNKVIFCIIKQNILIYVSFGGNPGESRE